MTAIATTSYRQRRRHLQSRSCALALAAVLLGAACSAQAAVSHQHLYVVGGYDVLVFLAEARGNVAPERVLNMQAPSSFSYQIAVDAQGYLYAPQPNLAAVYVYAPGASGYAMPVRIISGSQTTLQSPFGVATDRAGYMYVSDPYAKQVDVFAPSANGNVAPIRVISGLDTQLSIAAGYVAIDAGGDLFVEQTNVFSLNPPPGTRQMLEFAPGASGDAIPTASFDLRNGKPQSISVHEDTLYVSSFTGDNIAGVVDIYRLPELRLIQVLAYPHFEQKLVFAAAVSSDSRLHVLAGYRDYQAFVFAPSRRVHGEVMKVPQWLLDGPRTGFSEAATYLTIGP